jgi:hypothetical protein
VTTVGPEVDLPAPPTAIGDGEGQLQAERAKREAIRRAQLARAGRAKRSLTKCRETIAGVRAARGLQLQAPTRWAAVGVADLVERIAAHAESLPLHTAEVAAAAGHLRRAAQLADAVMAAPEAWGGMRLVAEALQLIGYAQSQCDAAEKLKAQRGKPRPNRQSAKQLILKAAADGGGSLSSEAISRKLEREAGVKVGSRHVRKVRADAAKA